MNRFLSCRAVRHLVMTTGDATRISCNRRRHGPCANAVARCPSRARSRRRRLPVGAATVEFALVASIVFLMILALLQFTGMILNQNVLTAAARSGARVAAMPETESTSSVIAAVEDRLSRGGIDPDDVTIQVTPSSLANLNTGDSILVEVSSPLSEMVWISVIIPPGLSLSSEMSYLRE